MKTEIIYKGENIIIVNKPPVAGTTPGADGEIELLKKLAPELKQPGGELMLVNQIDDEASGVAIIARDKQIYKQLEREINAGDIEFTYLALVQGAAIENEQTITTLITRSRANALLMTVPKKKGVTAITHCRVLANFGSAALVAAVPVTHRRHQVRVHLSHISLPVVADAAYGNPSGLFLSQFKAGYRSPGKDREEKPLLDRPAIHVYQMRSRAGLLAGRTAVAGLDKKFAAALKMLTKHNSRGMDAFAEADDLEKILRGLAL